MFKINKIIRYNVENAVSWTSDKEAENGLSARAVEGQGRYIYGKRHKERERDWRSAN